MYDERLISHFRNPRNAGELQPPAVTVEVSNPACGDILRTPDVKPALGRRRADADVAGEIRVAGYGEAVRAEGLGVDQTLGSHVGSKKDVEVPRNRHPSD